jgi:RHS repeat-associated protein
MKWTTRSSAIRTASETDGIHSNAYNFMSAVNAGVDPRTGMYSCSVSLPGAAANNLCGPTVGLGINFNPLNPLDAGFGIGWSLTTTRFDVRRSRVSLSSGESFRVDTFAGGKAVYKDRKLRTFDLFQRGPDSYVIVHKSGMTEWLKVIAGSEGVAVLTEVHSPEGHVVMLQQRSGNGVVQLDSMIDGTGRLLLSVTYELTHTAVTLHPGTTQASTFTFHFGNGRLEHLALPDGYGDGWVFGYELLNVVSPRRQRSTWQKLCDWFGRGNGSPANLDMLLLKSVVVPTGGREEVDYKKEGHPLPGGANRPMSHMPYVVECRRDPGRGQPVMRTRYTYSDNRNYFGFGAVNDWLDDEDNLYRIVMAPGQRYEYSSTEVQYDGIEPSRSVTRTFNRFHLLTSELTSQEGCIKEAVTSYDEDPEAPFGAQRSWCQLPVGTTTVYWLADRADEVRRSLLKTAYDEHGNIVETTDDRGAVEVFEYYPVEGLPGLCPPCPLGFVRFLREKRSLPPTGTDGPVRCVRYSYTELPSRIPGTAVHVVPVMESFLQLNADSAETLLGQTTQSFVDGGDDHGRLARVVSRHHDVENTTDYAYTYPVEEKDASGIDLDVLVTTVTKAFSNGQDTQRTSSAVANSCLNGLPVLTRAPDGVVMRYSHDALRRQFAEIVAADSTWAATTTSTFVLRHAGSEILKRSATGQETLVELDGFGTALRVLARNWDDDGIDHEIWRASFDGMGRKVEEVATDAGIPVTLALPPHEPGSDVPVTVQHVETRTTYVYDGWGNASEIHGTDGVVDYHSIDPILGVAERWEEANGSVGTLRSARTRSKQTLSGKPERVDILDDEGNVYRSQLLFYDGLDRLVRDVMQIEGEADRVTCYRYDAYDRPIETTHPDGAVVTTDYAVYTDASLVTALRIKHASLGPASLILGEQAYDPLGRRTLLRAGGRATVYCYGSSTSAKPNSVTLPSGATAFFSYEALGGDVVTDVTDSEGSTTYVYDKTSGDTLSVSNRYGEHHFEYDASGRLIGEASRPVGGDGDKRCTYRYSLRGRLIGQTGVDGRPQKHIYDRLGRFVRMECDDLTFDVTYDALSRVQGTLTQSRDGTRSMRVDVSLDEHDREVGRTLTARSGAIVTTQSYIQAYTKDDKLAERVLVQDGRTRTERFMYDIRGRMTEYACDFPSSLEDAPEPRLAAEALTFDALDNVLTQKCTYDSGDVITRRFTHADHDPTQLRSLVTEQSGQANEEVIFGYDSAGCMLHDEKGRSLLYDALGRPAGWSRDCARREYRYDALGRIGSSHDGQATQHRYYLGGRIQHMEGAGASSSFHHAMGDTLAQTKILDAVRDVVLLGSDSQASTVAEAGAGLSSLTYTPHGRRQTTGSLSDIGYTGELKEPDVDDYVLGHYRRYSPTLLRFLSPDATSPFGHGGLNAYAYCSGDPVNRSDPSGEGWLDWLFVGIGVIASGIAIVASGGTLLPAIGAMATLTASASQGAAVALLAVDATSLGLAAGSAAAMDAGNDALASKLGLASMVLGVGGMAAAAGPKLASHAIKGGKSFVAATRYVRPPVIRPPLALKAPRLRGGYDGPGRRPFAGAEGDRFGMGGPSGVDGIAAFVAPSQTEMRAMSGVQRVNAAAASPMMRRYMVSRGFASPKVLDQFPDGIDLAYRGSVVRARLLLSAALMGRTEMNAQMLSRTGFSVDELASLNPSRAVGGDELSDIELDLYQKSRGRLPGEEGEHFYSVFLQSRNPIDFANYTAILVRARAENRWANWNSPVGG